MKYSVRVVLVLLSLVLLSHECLAEIKIGALAGYRLNNATSDGAITSYKNTSGYQVGGVITFSLADIIGMRTGLIYAIRDVDFSQVFLGLNLSGKQKVSYLDIPLDLILRVPGIGLYGLAGFKYGSKLIDSCESASPGFVCTSYNSSSNIIANVGLGYEIVDLQILALSLEAEYEMGLTNTNTQAGGNKVTTNGFAFNVVGTF